ncbi:MAG: tRNA (adenosine(37)-N6)-threonylcarbamoyltransferase complex ATPase subunit type 1 TsaE [Spirochaetes bacterium]|nr:tRNA (adenosine(37)-N6)-threonylcarbamoyltransferase complex ATPase subunit type 1 TsaE [Spirochaetota bacterium]
MNIIIDKIKTKNVDETKEVALNFAKILKSNDIVILDGELGSGKTVFMKGIANYFKIEEDIISPTFLIVNSYDIKVNFENIVTNNNNSLKLKINHFDLYRIDDFDELYYIGIEEYIESSGNINFFEWGMKFLENFIEYNINNIYIVKLKVLSENEREIKIEKLVKE